MFPRLSELPKGIIESIIGGLIYSYVFSTNPKVTACAFTILPIAHTVLFAVGNPVFGGDCGERSLKVKVMTDLISGIINIFALNRLRIIGSLGIGVFSSLTFLGFLGNVKKLRKVQLQNTTL